VLEQRSHAAPRGQPEHGAELADDLERLVALRMDPKSIQERANVVTQDK
jgi:hypothetical protein